MADKKIHWTGVTVLEFAEENISELSKMKQKRLEEMNRVSVEALGSAEYMCNWSP